MSDALAGPYASFLQFGHPAVHRSPMNRMPSSPRRRNITDASSGFPERVTVGLYACVYDDRDPEAVIEALRKHAEARDWVVHNALYDTSDITSDRGSRESWPKVERLLQEGQVSGFVAPTEDEIAFSPQDKAQVRNWLLELPAFASYLKHKDGHSPENDAEAMLP
ncbi:hypothetical protein [Streptomyces syringium]|uniref:hypothetical protein n=2 Tax=Streptomyces syringium TaxID=76729 RepID=UPI003439FC95